jgi:histidyl-tRNA synthetase
MSKKKSQRLKPRLPAGFEDHFADAVVARRRMMATLVEVFELHGFAPLETPAIEYVDVLGKMLPESDAPSGGIFAFQDDDEQWMALRYDLTAPLARVVAQYSQGQLPRPFRRYQSGAVWRQEKPGPGRFRQFLQCDFDTVGTASMAADAETCSVLATGMEALGIERGDYVVRVNNRKVLNGVLEAAQIPGDEALRTATLRAVDKLDRLGVDGVRELLGKGRRDDSGDFTPGAQLAPGQIDQILAFVEAGTGDRGAVCARFHELVGDSPVGLEGIRELEEVALLLDGMGLGEDRVVFDPSVVRGLAYYTGPVFETELLTQIVDEKGRSRNYGSVASGGRYDGLVQRFTGTEVPATGASFGVSRLLAALQAQGRAGGGLWRGPVVVTVMDRGRLVDYQRMVSELRSAGIPAEMYQGTSGFRAQMKYADKSRAPVAVIAGEDEFAAGTISLKNLALGMELSRDIADRQEWTEDRPAQQTVTRDQLVRAVRDMLGD